MRFTNSPYEWLMKQKPGPTSDHDRKGLPENHPCYGCGNAMALQPCLLPCWKTLTWGPPGPIPDPEPEEDDSDDRFPDFEPASLNSSI